MRKRMRRLVMETATKMTRLVTPVLLPDERDDFFRAVEKIIRDLVEKCQREADTGRMEWVKPSMN